MDRSQDPFIERALRSLADAQAGGPVYDGPANARYLLDRVRSALTGSEPCVTKPEPTTLTVDLTSGWNLSLSVSQRSSH